MITYKDVIVMFKATGRDGIKKLLTEGRTSRDVVRKAAKHANKKTGEELRLVLILLSGVKLKRPKRVLSPKPRSLQGETPPLCACGCGKHVEESRKNPGTWNNYHGRHGSLTRAARFGVAPLCKCGCGQPVTWTNSLGGRWHAYADHFPLITEIGPYCTKKQIAAVLTSIESAVEGSKTGVSTRTVERRVQSGDLPAPVLVRVDGKTALHSVFRVSDLDPIMQRKLQDDHKDKKQQEMRRQ